MRAPLPINGGIRAPSPQPIVGGAVQGATQPQKYTDFESFRRANLGKYQTSSDLFAAYYAQNPSQYPISTYPGLNLGDQLGDQLGGNEIGSSSSGYDQETRARNDRIMNQPIDRSIQGGGTGGGGGSLQGRTLPGTIPPGGSPTQLFPPGSNTPGTNSPYINPGNSIYPTAPPTNYQSPQQLNPGGMTPGQPPQGGAVQMRQANPQAAMNQYLNSPGYQLLGDPSMQRFQHSPGYQYAVDEAMRQTQRGAASRGLLESGSVMRDMTDRAQGMAQQDYGNWWNRQNQLFGDYQNRLQGLAGGPTGSDQAYNLGNNMAQGSLQTGENLGTLFGNQGMAGYGGMMNTGANQANNIMNAGNQQIQIAGTNQATRLGGAIMGGLF